MPASPCGRMQASAPTCTYACLYYTRFRVVIQSERGTDMRIRLLDAAGARQLYESRMARDFPPGELKPFAAMEELLAAGLYEPLTFTDDAGGRAGLRLAGGTAGAAGRAGGLLCRAQRPAGQRHRHPGAAPAAGPTTHPGWPHCCWSASTPPKPRMRPLPGGASGFTCGPGHGLRRWKAGCSVRGTAFCSCPAARHCCLTAH